MSQPPSLREQIIARAIEDDTFRQHVLQHPREAVERALGLTLPPGVSLQVHEDTPTTLHVILPAKSRTGTLQDLSDEELDQVAGGTAVFGNSSHPHIWSQQSSTDNGTILLE